MSKLDELILEFCPNGVDYITLGELCYISNAGVDKNSVDTEQPVMLLNYMDVYRNKVITHDLLTMKVTASKSKVDGCNIKSGDIFITPTSETIDDIGHAAVAIETIAGGVYSYHLMRLRLKEPNMFSSFYLYYLFSSSIIQNQVLKLATGLTRFGLSKNNWGKIRIPFPSLPVQQEIVRILDNFTQLTTELTVELTARQKQYEYYLEHFSSCIDGSLMKNIGEIFSTVTDYVAAGSFADIAENVSYLSKPDFAQLVRTMDIKSSFIKGSSVFVDENAFKFLWRVNLDRESIIMPNIGVNCGEVYYITPQDLPYKNNVLGPNAILLRSEKYNNRYLFYLLKTDIFQRPLRTIISPGGQTKFNKTELKKIKLPIPSLEEQNRIATLLDHFDIICNNNKIGLPAEIEARKKQYEYYRDKLLTFKEKES